MVYSDHEELDQKSITDISRKFPTIWQLNSALIRSSGTRKTNLWYWKPGTVFASG